MTAFWFSLVVLLVCFGVYLAVGFLRSVSRGTDEGRSDAIEILKSIEAARYPAAAPTEEWVYDPALAAPKRVARYDWPVTDHATIEPEPEPEPESGPSGVYNVVYWSDDRTQRREKQLFADNPNQARQLADQHEAEYVRETGAAPYSFSRIDHPEEQQAD